LSLNPGSVVACTGCETAAVTVVLPPLHLNDLTITTPVVLAPMAGVTNRAFRRLCREHGAGLYVAEMVTSRALVERTPESLRIIAHDPDETPRSLQVYGTDPATVGAAVAMIASEDRADHVDLNFGCPVPKVTRKGGGAALPWKRDLFEAIVRAAVDAAAPHGVPVTIKMRMGIDDEHLTYLEAGQIAQRVGVAAVALHARTAAQYYSGSADWSAIARLKESLEIPVLGNGDIWSAEDAVAMVEATGCDGVVVGRGCQGRPWLFADLAAAFHGSSQRVRPGLGEVAATIRRHAELMVEDLGEVRGIRELRKHMAWYFKGYVVGGEQRHALGLVATLAELDERLAALDLDQPHPGSAAEGPRGRAGSPKRPVLPEHWLDSREIDNAFAAQLRDAELSVSGG
jgi:nifR3 family TIM-barrel protein